MNRTVQVLFLLLSGVFCVETSEVRLNETEELRPTHSEEEEYKEYFARQKRIYQGLISLDIPGARPLGIDAIFADQVLTNCSKKILTVISRIKQNRFPENKKNIIFYGPSGTGKSVLAQAIAIKCKIPCLFFNAGTISTEYMNSGVQNLNKIFEQAQGLEQGLDEPCIVILDELESLTKKHAETSNHESNILINFWSELDKLAHTRVVFIGTMNDITDVPRQIIARTSMIKIPLPEQTEREAIASYHLNATQNKYNIEYSEGLTAASLAAQTHGFSNRDLKNLATEAFESAINNAIESGSSAVVQKEDVLNAIHDIKQEYREEKQRTIKKHLYDYKFTVPVIGLMLTTVGIGLQIIAIMQNRRISERQMSTSQIAKTAAINGSVLGAIILGISRFRSGKSLWGGWFFDDKEKDSDK
ncbi:AAA family ATPase [Candidatus Babeliales bacterium]|nr:AAA family ATPase [Candidatus Babeliales bacterium]